MPEQREVLAGLLHAHNRAHGKSVRLLEQPALLLQEEQKDALDVICMQCLATGEASKALNAIGLVCFNSKAEASIGRENAVTTTISLDAGCPLLHGIGDVPPTGVSGRSPVSRANTARPRACSVWAVSRAALATCRSLCTSNTSVSGSTWAR